jgi:hypothetical protein
MRGLEQRLADLESSAHKGGNHIIVFVEYEGTDKEQTTAHIVERCEAACDKETYNRAFGAALVAINGKNPFASEKDVSFIVITEEIAKMTMENLLAEGIEIVL